ncbi:MAG: 3'-5' exonuclease [Bacilli bacterium]
MARQTGFSQRKSIEDGSTDEEERLFYVAATRAKDCLIIAYPRVSTSGGDYEMREQSRFLNGVDPSLFEVL